MHHLIIYRLKLRQSTLICPTTEQYLSYRERVYKELVRRFYKYVYYDFSEKKICNRLPQFFRIFLLALVSYQTSS